MRNKLIRRRLSAIVVVAWLISFESTLRAVAVTPRTQVVPHPISSIPQVQSASNTSLAIEAADSVGPISPILETPTAVDPWVAFEEEYKPSKRISWQAGRWLQSAKYRLDTAAFLIKESAKKLQKEGKLSEDDAKRIEKEIQVITDRFIKDIDAQLAAKEKELTTV